MLVRQLIAIVLAAVYLSNQAAQAMPDWQGLKAPLTIDSSHVQSEALSIAFASTLNPILNNTRLAVIHNTEEVYSKSLVRSSLLVAGYVVLSIELGGLAAEFQKDHSSNYLIPLLTGTLFTAVLSFLAWVEIVYLLKAMLDTGRYPLIPELQNIQTTPEVLPWIVAQNHKGIITSINHTIFTGLPPWIQRSYYYREQSDLQKTAFGRFIQYAFGDLTIPLTFFFRSRFIRDEQYIAEHFEHRRIAEEKVRSLDIKITLDPLTGALNKAGLAVYVSGEISRAQRSGEPLTIIYIDGDGMKSINDTFGHNAGDAVIKHMANMMKKTLKRESDKLGRFGGDEFVVILPQTDQPIGFEIAEQLRSAVAEKPLIDILTESGINLEGQSIDAARQMKISLGVASFKSGDTLESLNDRADQGLYKAKRLGRNRAESVEDTFGPSQKRNPVLNRQS